MKKLLCAIVAGCALSGAAAKEWPGFQCGIGMGGWLTNYKRFNVLPAEWRMPLTIGDLEHFDTYMTEADVERVKKWGFDHIRVGFDQIVLEEAPCKYRERTFRRLDDFVGWCEKHGMNLVLNLHKAVGNYCDIKETVQLLDDEGLQNRFVALWLEIERRYHDHPGLAFELLNEVRDVDPGKWNALAGRTLEAIREKNPGRWVVIGSTCWNSPDKLADLKVWDDPKVVYTFHMYEPFDFTHQRGVLQDRTLYYNRTMQYPTDDVERYRAANRLRDPESDGGYRGVMAIDRSYLKNLMRGAVEFRKAHPDKILWNGEFGTIRHAPAASRAAYMRDVVSICKEAGIPWCVWNYLSTPNDGNRFSLVDDDTREFLSQDLLDACLGNEKMATALSAAFAEAAPGAIRPRGHLAEFLRRETDGMLGHREKLGYPFDTGLWSEPIKSIHFTEGVYNGDDEDKSGTEDWWRSGAWWPFEQTAYLLDAMARTGALMPAPGLDAEVKKCVDALIANRREDGDLFKFLSNSDSQWPFVVFFRAAWAYAERTGDERVWEALKRHYDSKRSVRRKWQGRDALNIEGMIVLWAKTGDKTLLDDAVACWKQAYQHRNLVSSVRVHEHGVSFAEDLKIPAILYCATGEKRYLGEAKRAYENAFRLNEQASGQISCNEFLSGRDPRQGYESCVIADMMWSLGWFLKADGDVEAADRMEKLAYNVLPGAITKDFRRHQYLSSVNQVACTPFSQSSHFNYGESTWRQYRPSHFPQCCTGNILRALPDFVQRMWMADTKDGHPVAMLFGPCEISGEYKGVKYKIVEETGYPFEEEVRFTVKVSSPVEMPVSYRVPKWAARPDAGRFAAEKRFWRDGDTFAVRLPMRVEFHSDRNWHWFTYGPLALSYAVPSTTTEERPGDPFTPITVVPAGDWNFAVDVAEIAKSGLKVERRDVQFPFETPALAVKIPVVEIKEWQTLDEQRFTPDPPLYAHPTGKRRTIELVPYGTTLSRITCFPDATERRQLPVVAAYTSGECYDFDPARPLSEQKYDPETWSDKDFRSKYKVPQRTKELYFDFLDYFGPVENKLAYALFRIWSDEEGEATFCVGAASRWQAFIDGDEAASSGDGWVEGEMMAPEWFNHRVRRGYNYVLLKVATTGRSLGQFRREWGAKVEAFISKQPHPKKLAPGE